MEYKRGNFAFRQSVDKRDIALNAEARRCGVRRGVARFSANSTSSVFHLNGGRRSPTNRPLTGPIEEAETVRHVSLRVASASPLLRVEDYAHRPKALSGLPTDCGIRETPKSLVGKPIWLQPAFCTAKCRPPSHFQMSANCHYHCLADVAHALMRVLPTTPLDTRPESSRRFRWGGRCSRLGRLR